MFSSAKVAPEQPNPVILDSMEEFAIIPDKDTAKERFCAHGVPTSVCGKCVGACSNGSTMQEDLCESVQRADAHQECVLLEKQEEDGSGVCMPGAIEKVAADDASREGTQEVVLQVASLSQGKPYYKIIEEKQRIIENAGRHPCCISSPSL